METLYLPENLRSEMQKPWGISIFGSEEEIGKQYNKIISQKKYQKVITVGDRCSLSLSSDIKIFDGKINRKEIDKSLPFRLSFANPAGTIQKVSWEIVKQAIREEENIFVEGEEDLLVIPVVLLAENDTAVVYGLRGKGVCLIEVSDEIKNTFKMLLSKFITH